MLLSQFASFVLALTRILLSQFASFLTSPIASPACHHTDARLLAMGPIYGPILCCIIAVQHWFLLVLTFCRPIDEIETVAASWDPERFREVSARRLSLRPTDKQECEREQGSRLKVQ